MLQAEQSTFWCTALGIPKEQSCQYKQDFQVPQPEAGDNEVEKCSWVPEERMSVLGYQRTLVNLRLPRNFGQP